MCVVMRYAGRVTTDPAFRRWAEATRASLEMMRAALKAAYPEADERRIEALLRARLGERRAAKLDAYERNG